MRSRGQRRCALSTQVREIEHRVRKLGGVDDLGVVDQHSLPTREPDPTAVLGVEALGDAVEDIVGERAQKALLIEIPDGTGRLGQEHVGWRLVGLLPDQQRQIRGVSVPRLDSDPRLLREAIEDRLDQVLGPARVDRHRATAGGPAIGAAPGEGRDADEHERRDDPNRRAHQVKVPSHLRKVHLALCVA